MITDITTTGLKLRCKIHVPLAADGHQVPLLIFLHGIGENADKKPSIESVLAYGPLDQYRDGVDIGPAKDWIKVHPQNPSGDFTVAEIDDVLMYCIVNYNVDLDRIYLMGVSNGGEGVWRYASSPEHVKKIAAIIPICGGDNDPTKASVLVNEGIPGWAAHALNDTVVPYSRTKRMVDAVNTLAGRSQILFSEYGMWGHGAWNYFLKPEYGVYDWLKYQRISNRRKNQIILRSGDQIIISVT